MDQILDTYELFSVAEVSDGIRPRIQKFTRQARYNHHLRSSTLESKVIQHHYHDCVHITVFLLRSLSKILLKILNLFQLYNMETLRREYFA